MKRSKRIYIKQWYLSLSGLALLVVSCLLMVLGASIGGGLGLAGLIVGVLLFAGSIMLITPG